jgi:stress-induced morphogen
MSRADQLQSSLTAGFAPSHLEIVNESFKHSVKPGSETHFKVVIVSSAFEGLGPLQRHRRVNEVVAESFRAGLHALSIHAKTPAEWGDSPVAMATPDCLGGSKRGKAATAGDGEPG